MTVHPNPLLKDALASCRAGFIAVVVFSLFINVLMLTAPLYTLQIFDRVIAARSGETLLYLSLIAGFALLTLAALEAVRARVMVGLSTWLDRCLGGSILEGSIGASTGSGRAPSIQGLRDLAALRIFLTGPGMFPILDAPWTPIFIAVIFMMHTALGWLSLGGAMVLFALAIANELTTRNLLLRSGDASMAAMRQAESAVRNANVIEAMGMMPNLVERWRAKNAEMLNLQAHASTRAGAIAAMSKFVRQGLQVSILGAGAWLVMGGEITAGMMIAGSILMSRALAPVDQAIGSWKSAITARSAYQRVRDLLAAVPVRGTEMALPRPTGSLRVEGVTFFHPETTEATLKNVSFRLEPGEVLGLIGPTAAGKSTLASLLVGIAKPHAGAIRLDETDVADWAAEDLGRHIGYLPQDIELFAGTVRENIARMGEASPESVISAAQIAGVHELILRLPSGYETEIGESGAALSGGQRQRIALARAAFGHPSFVVLDEPNASLDVAGEEALINAIAALKKSGATLVVIAHRPSILRHADKVLVVRSGIVEAFGPPSEILRGVSRAQLGDRVQAS